MNRSRGIALLTVAFAAALLPPASAGKPKTVVVEGQYQAPAAGVFVGQTGGSAQWQCELRVGCLEIELPRGYRYAKVEVVDVTGTTVRAILTPASGDADICGRTTTPLLVTGLERLTVAVVPGTCEDGATPSTPTTGIVRLTLGMTDRSVR